MRIASILSLPAIRVLQLGEPGRGPGGGGRFDEPGRAPQCCES
jgi:hypothetical protein